MHLNHLNLTVTDVPAAREFLITYFGLRPMEGGTITMSGLWDDHGFALVLLRGGNTAPVSYPNGFHIGFTQENAATVDEINQQLRAGGFDVPAPREMHGSWAFYFEAPGGFVIEVSS